MGKVGHKSSCVCEHLLGEIIKQTISIKRAQTPPTKLSIWYCKLSGGLPTRVFYMVISTQL